MRQYAIALGIDSADILTEEKAEHSTENVYYSYQLAKSRNWENVALATDYVQVKMVRNFVSKEQIPIVYLPMVIHIVDTMAVFNQPAPHINDSIAYVKDFVPITERESRHKRWRGTRGKNIKKEQK